MSVADTPQCLRTLAGICFFTREAYDYLNMSAAEQFPLPFEMPISSIPETDAIYPQTAILAIADQLEYVDREKFGADQLHYEGEFRFVAMLREWLTEADRLFRERSYSACRNLLKLVLDDIALAGCYSPDVPPAITEAIETCYALYARKAGDTVISKSVASAVPLAS